MVGVLILVGIGMTIIAIFAIVETIEDLNGDIRPNERGQK